ncbi:Platelet-activating factor acetylhydrolase [Phlyctochytrium planicorne]|nr:Platelet-activating factor acetylhydrolase [Phlyctochytrium planicorne]
MYSTLCSNLASRGFVVLAIEHRDGSACTSGRNNFTERIEYNDPLGDSYTGRKGTAHAIDYHNNFRANQITYRKREIREALSVLARLNNGESLEDLDNMLDFEEEFRSRNGPGVSSRQWGLSFEGRLDVGNVVMMGHSFGGATAVSALQDVSFGFRAGIVLDPFMCTVLDARTPILCPMLGIQCHFFHWRENLLRIIALHKHQKAHPLNDFAYIRETIHQDLSDLPCISPMLMRKLGIASKCDPKRVFACYDRMICEFVGRVLGDVNLVAGRVPRRGGALVGGGGEDVNPFLDDGPGGLSCGEKAVAELFDGIPETWQELFPHMTE